MIKITNLNFQNQTIESIEVNGETVDNLQIKLTKTKFNIVIVKDKKVIQKEIKKKDVPEKAVDVVIEEVEQVIEDIKEEMTLAKMKDLLKEHIPKKNTLVSYGRTIQQVFEYFKVQTIHELLEQDIIDYIEEKYESISTIKSKLCAMYKVYKLLNLEGQLFKSKIDYYVNKQTLHQDKHRELNKKTTTEGNAIIKYFENKLAELETVKEDNWTQQSQLYCILKIYLTYGVLRPSELLHCKVTEKDCECNHINVSTKQIVIHHHKNDRKGKKVIHIDDELVECLRKGLGRYLVTNQSDKLYQSSSAFTKAFKKEFDDYTPYDLRRAISSRCIAQGNVNEIKKLEHNQGHSLNVILEHYNVYSK
jgi:integrase